MAKLLNNAYARFNRKYFNGCLPAVPVRWSERIDPVHQARKCRAYGLFQPSEDGVGTILLAASTKGMWDLWNWTLLHEMCHVKVREHAAELAANGDKHSKPWQHEMRRLAAEGAFDKIW